MARVRLLERDDAPLAARYLYRDDGSASPLTRSLVNAPDVLETFMPFLAQVYAASSIDLATKELVIVRVSQLNACRYCLAAHRPVALDAGVPPSHVAAVCDEAPLAELPERERTLIEWVDHYVLDPASIDDDLVARVLDHVRDDQLIELALVAGVTQLLNHYCTAFAIPAPRP
ncbi:MAG: carboxymuconolactone decarboxylase family protein [Actinobacteria bacterium]|nr:carboxymuconolactone decarboxylase family protein [Actinomycetota bacterium]